MSESRKYTVEIFGQKYTLVATERDNVEVCAGLVDNAMKAVALKLPRHTEEARVAVLAALQLAGTCQELQDALRLQQEQAGEQAMRAQRLFDVIDHVLLVDGI